MISKEKRIITVLVINFAFFLLEIIVGYSLHSLVLIADSFHMLNDIVSLLIAYWAIKIKKSKQADSRYTYGWLRAEVLGALINSVFLIALCFIILIESVQRFFFPVSIKNPEMILIVGIIALLSNCIGLILFHNHSHTKSKPVPVYSIELKNNDTMVKSDFQIKNNFEKNDIIFNHKTKRGDTKSLNLHGVFLHILGDAFSNMGVILTGLFIWKSTYSWKNLVDPISSLILCVIIFSTTWPLCSRASKILLQATPSDINSEQIINEILKLPLVKSIHDFHVWNLDESILISSMHLALNQSKIQIAENNSMSEDFIEKTTFLKLVSDVREVLHKFGIHSATIQPEFTKLIDNNTNVIKYGQSNKETCFVDELINCDMVICK